MRRDLYEILGVTRDAPNDELRKAYRRLAKQFHPDANPDDPDAEEQFKDVQYAYEVLGDPERRRRYDLFGEGDEREKRSAKDIFDDLTEQVYAEEHVIPSSDDPMAVARAFIAERYQHPQLDLLCWQSGDFYGWDSMCWPNIEDRALESEIYTWAEGALYEVKIGPFMLFKRWRPNRRKVADVFDALRAAAHLSMNEAPPTWITKDDQPPASEMIVMRNGLLHLPSRKLLEHTPHFWTHHCLPFDYDPRAPKPKLWLEFLAELWGEDEQSIAALQEWFGYVISGDTSLQKMLLLIGPLRSGKGTIGRALVALVGRHNAASPTLASLATNFGLAPLINKPLALVSDARISESTNTSIVVERLLSISGEDSLTVDRKYKEHWTGPIPARITILSNELPRLADSSTAFANRFIVLVLSESFLGREDETLTARLLTELTGIFNWALDGLDQLRARGHLAQPYSGREAMEALADLGSPVATFVRERCTVGPTCSVVVDALFHEWTRWCEEQGSRHGDIRAFGRDLRAAVPGVRKGRHREKEEGRIQRYLGIAIRPLNEEASP